MNALFALDGVVNLRDVRHWLRTVKTGSGVVRDLAVVEDDVLHDAILKVENVVCIKRVYVRVAVGSAQLDPLRSVVIDIVQKKEIIRRNDVISAAKAKGLKVTERSFETVMREICISKDGGFWMMKTGRNSV